MQTAYSPAIAAGLYVVIATYPTELGARHQ